MKLQHRPLLSAVLAGAIALVLSCLAYALMRLTIHQVAGDQLTDWEFSLVQHPWLLPLGIVPLPAAALLLVEVTAGLVYGLGKFPRAKQASVQRLLLSSFALLTFLLVLLVAVSTTTPVTALIAAGVLAFASAPYFLLANAAFYPIERQRRERVKKVKAQPVTEPEPEEPVVETEPDVAPTPRAAIIDMSDDGSYAVVRMGEDATIENVAPVGSLEVRMAAADVPAVEPEQPEDAEVEAPAAEQPAAKISEEELAERLRAARRELRSYQREQGEDS